MATGSTRAKRRLGRHVRPIMERAGLKAGDVARMSKTSRDTVDRMLAGAHLPRYTTLVAILTLLRATESEIAEATVLWERANKTAVKIENADVLAPSYLRFRMDEGEAKLERTLDQQLIPGPFQLGGYAEELGERAKPLTAGSGWTSAAAAERDDRRGLLDREEDPLLVDSLIDESALYRIIGSRELMADQLDVLAERAKKPNVTIRIVPFERGSYGLHYGALTLLQFPEADEPISAYVEEHTGVRAVEDAEEVDRLVATWDAAAELALDPERSAERIIEVRDTRYATR
ncbi:helix-turn-helix domain-containing protein [Saccharothrix sp. HUAS TT1]|uniref:helix-turn-helix domain-containing protein n=1 Tax=unclassified Saccharothrix TaxID=2593673 RepID=UPI00345C10B4